VTGRLIRECAALKRATSRGRAPQQCRRLLIFASGNCVCDSSVTEIPTQAACKRSVQSSKEGKKQQLRRRVQRFLSNASLMARVSAQALVSP
jgi:hypothetical protein